MSIRLWEEIARQKEETEKQRENILNAFKEHKVAQEMGSMKAEKLFRPITRRLPAELDPAKKPQEEREDFYANFDRDLFEEGDVGDEMANLFDDGQELLPQNEGVKPKFVRDIPLPDDDDLAQEEDFPPELGEEVFPGEKAKPPAGPTPSRSPPPSYSNILPKTMSRDDFTKHLSVLNKFLITNRNNPDAVLTTEGRQLSYEQAQEEADAIYAIRAHDLVVHGISPGKKQLGPYTGKSHKEIRQMLGIAQEPGQFTPPTKKKTGKGFSPRSSLQSLPSLIQRLSLGISSIFAGNSSLKLREEVQAIAQFLFKNGILSQEQKNKVLSLK